MIDYILMKLSFDLKLFAEEYITLALKIAENNPSLENFDGSLRKTLADKMGILEREVTFLHHSFHWTFFCEPQSGSPIGLSFNSKEGVTYVTRLERINPDEKFRLTDYLMKKYGDYLAERLKNLVNISLQ